VRVGEPSRYVAAAAPRPAHHPPAPWSPTRSIAWPRASTSRSPPSGAWR
jgi:hypothetical protein